VEALALRRRRGRVAPLRVPAWSGRLVAQAGPPRGGFRFHLVGGPVEFVLGVGFLALVLSPWRSIASFGLISAAAILVAVACALLVLPATLAAVARRP
jgi:hypothetical protein